MVGISRIALENRRHSHNPLFCPKIILGVDQSTSCDIFVFKFESNRHCTSDGGHEHRIGTLADLLLTAWLCVTRLWTERVPRMLGCTCPQSILTLLTELRYLLIDMKRHTFLRGIDVQNMNTLRFTPQPRFLHRVAGRANAAQDLLLAHGDNVRVVKAHEHLHSQVRADSRRSNGVCRTLTEHHSIAEIDLGLEYGLTVRAIDCHKLADRGGELVYIFQG